VVIEDMSALLVGHGTVHRWVHQAVRQVCRNL